MCNKLNRLVTKVDEGIAKVMIADGRFTEELSRQIASQSDEEALNELLAEEFAESVSSKYPMMGKYLDAGSFAGDLDISRQLQDISQGGDPGKAAFQIVQTAASKFTAGIRSKIKSVRLKALITVLLLQALAFGVVFYQASKYRSPAASDSFYESNDYL